MFFFLSGGRATYSIIEPGPFHKPRSIATAFERLVFWTNSWRSLIIHRRFCPESCFSSCRQEAAGAFCTEDLGSDVIFLPIHQAAWLNKSQAVGRAHVREMMAQTSWAYCQGFARALHIWFGQEEAAWLSSVKQLHRQLLTFCGGNCRTESYEPTFIESSVTSFLWKVLSCA